MTNLADLPMDHPLRNTALADIRAEYRSKSGIGGWKQVTPKYAIARKTYNDLSPAWTDTSDWRTQEPTA